MKKSEGKWIVKTHIISDDEYICSNCGYTTNHSEKTCPKCGIKMSGKDKDLGWVEESIFLDLF